VNGNENKWRDMNAAEWRGKIGEKIDRLESLVAASCAKVDSHDTELAILRDRDTRAQLGWKPKAIIAAALIGAITSIIITLIN
jgi:hypothetical protein